MSVKVISRVWKSSRHGGSALLLLIALADWADDWGYCYPGHEAMARKIRSTERNVYYLLRKLEESGEIRVINRGRGGKGAETSIYQVIVGLNPEEMAESERLSPIVFSVSPENFSPENFSPENFSPEKSFTALNVLINRQFNAAESINIQQHYINDGLPENFSPENFSPENFSREEPEGIPQDIRDRFKQLGWRGSMMDIESAWRKDPERVRQWLWYAKKQGLTGALLRTVLRNDGEYPPELDPSSPKFRRRYIEGPYAEFIEH